MAGHPALHLEPISDVLVQEAERLGLERRLRGADALYAATAARLGCPFLSWDRELVAPRGRAAALGLARGPKRFHGAVMLDSTRMFPPEVKPDSGD